jgi:hypothetical protein
MPNSVGDRDFFRSPETVGFRFALPNNSAYSFNLQPFHNP